MVIIVYNWLLRFLSFHILLARLLLTQFLLEVDVFTFFILRCVQKSIQTYAPLPNGHPFYHFSKFHFHRCDKNDTFPLNYYKTRQQCVQCDIQRFRAIGYKVVTFFESSTFPYCSVMAVSIIVFMHEIGYCKIICGQIRVTHIVCVCLYSHQ